jgi:hypothetical protein
MPILPLCRRKRHEISGLFFAGHGIMSRSEAEIFKISEILPETQWYFALFCGKILFVLF